MPIQHIRQFSTVHNSAYRFLEEHTLWGQTVFCVWLPNQDAVVSVPRSALQPLNADMQSKEEAKWSDELQSTQRIVPEIRPLLMLCIIKGGAQ